jgi:hypothetical protein
VRVVDGKIVGQRANASPQDERPVQIEGEGLVIGDRFQGLLLRDPRLFPRRPRARPKTAEVIS